MSFLENYLSDRIYQIDKQIRNLLTSESLIVKGENADAHSLHWRHHSRDICYQ